MGSSGSKFSAFDGPALAASKMDASIRERDKQ
jgi:hypothetical protein